jgi:hypothetical protein
MFFDGKPPGQARVALQRQDAPLTKCPIVQEVKGRRHKLGEIVGAMHDVGAESLGEFIDCYLQPALPRNGAEKIELNPIVDADHVVGDHADQAEGTGMVNLVEEIDAD